MITQIRIRNFALIEDVSLEFDCALNVFTGESGAGKTILIDALSLILGERLNSDILRQQDKNAVIDAVFEIKNKTLRQHADLAPWMNNDDDQLILRREITPDGKSKCQVNSEWVNVSVLRQIGKHLVDFHGQHDHQKLIDPANHMPLLDQFTSIGSPIAVYRKIFDEFTAVKKQLAELTSMGESRQRECDLLKYQIDEIERVKPKQDEDASLLEEHQRLANAEKLYEASSRLLELLTEEDGSAIDRIGLGQKAMREITRVDQSLEPITALLNDAEIALIETVRSIQSYRDNLSFDERRLKEIEDRLDDLEKIKRKYGGSISNALQFLLREKRRYETLVHFDERNEELTKTLKTLERQVKDAAEALTLERKQAAKKLSVKIEKELKDLGIKNPRFECRVESAEPNENGCDRAEFFINLNLGQELYPLASIISGGEASRVMLALKRAFIDADQIPTMVFDEIDNNVGGRLGSIVGEKLSEISKKHQVLMITHLPQIASFAQNHIRVTKMTKAGRTQTIYQPIKGEERVRELSQMLAGTTETDSVVQHARELLQGSVSFPRAH